MNPSFQTTRWTQVQSAKPNSDSGRSALADLCEAYYEPVRSFIFNDVRDADVANDLSHDFFASLLGGGGIDKANPENGRFRCYLLGAVKHFLAHRRQAARRLRRGGGVEQFSLDEEPDSSSIPDQRAICPDAEFDRQWALAVLSHALERLRRECVVEGKAQFFEQVKPWLTGEAAHGDQRELADRCAMSPAALKMAVVRIKQRFRAHVKSEVEGTLAAGAMVEDEMRSLQAALGG